MSRWFACNLLRLRLLVVADPTPAAAACRPRHAHTLVTHGGTSVYAIERDNGEGYGPATTFYACAKGRKTAAKLQHFYADLAPELLRAAAVTDATVPVLTKNGWFAWVQPGFLKAVDSDHARCSTKAPSSRSVPAAT